MIPITVVRSFITTGATITIHSSYNNLIISGLCGIRPDKGDSLIINPLGG